MQREIRQFEIKCDRCFSTARVEVLGGGLPELPEGWTQYSNPQDHWIVKPDHFCPSCYSSGIGED